VVVATTLEEFERHLGRLLKLFGEAGKPALSPADVRRWFHSYLVSQAEEAKQFGTSVHDDGHWDVLALDRPEGPVYFAAVAVVPSSVTFIVGSATERGHAFRDFVEHELPTVPTNALDALASRFDIHDRIQLSPALAYLWAEAS
jgi:hypothetical protein